MGGLSSNIGEDSNLLEARFDFLTFTERIAEEGERCLESGESHIARNSGRPVFIFLMGTGPPPVTQIVGGPSDAIVDLVFRTRDAVTALGQAGKGCFQRVYHW